MVSPTKQVVSKKLLFKSAGVMFAAIASNKGLRTPKCLFSANALMHIFYAIPYLR